MTNAATQAEPPVTSMEPSEPQTDPSIVKLRINIRREVSDDITTIRELAGLDSATQAVNDAIALYAFLLKEKKKGRKILIQSRFGARTWRLFIRPRR